mgnify:CR=1 FL=1
MVNKENTNVTGLESSTNFEQDEKSLVKALLEAADYKTGNEDSIKKIFVKKQSGETLFSFRIRGLSQSEIQAAATKQIPNPAGPKYPKISGERSTTEYHNNLIYTATVDEDKQRIWGNNDIKQKFNIFDETDCVDILLNAGTKSKVVDEILKLSGFDGEDVVDEDDYIKN